MFCKLSLIIFLIKTNNKIMGYSFYIISKEKQIKEDDYNKAFEKLSEFNKTGGICGRTPCDVMFNNNKKKSIVISGSYNISGQYVEGFVLNLLMNLLDLGYTPKVLSRDWNYGSEEDWEWLEE
jgi:hypothetical protein